MVIRHVIPAAAVGWQMRIGPRRDAGSLAAVMWELIDWLVAEGGVKTTQRNLVRAAARLASWLDADGVELADLDAACVFRLVAGNNERHPEHRSVNEHVSAVVPILQVAGRLKPSAVPAPRQGAAEAGEEIGGARCRRAGAWRGGGRRG